MATSSAVEYASSRRRYRVHTTRVACTSLHSGKQLLLFPSLGPTALLFFELPMAETSSARNALIGHAVAIGAGALSRRLRPARRPERLLENVTSARIGAGASSVALTGAVLLLLDSSHPPTGATTLIVSLGFLRTPPEMDALMVGVVLLTVVGWLVNRAAGVPVPLWSAEG